MKLTKKEKQLCIDKWQWIFDHPKIDELSDDLWTKLFPYDNFCPLCTHYSTSWEDELMCEDCPIVIQSGNPCVPNGYFAKWKNAKTTKTRKKYAGKLLEIMKSL